MIKLEDIKKDAQIQGLEAGEIVRVIAVETIGTDSLTVYYKGNQGPPKEQMLFRSDEMRLDLAQAGRPWAFDASGAEFKLGLEAYRIHLAHLFDPMMAIHTSNVEPLPHQISAVYESMLPRQPLRFLLADDPGAGKTIMAGLLIQELLIRADAKRILIVSPGSLTEQWQDEFQEKFGLQFELFSREKQEQCASGNYFEEQNLLIARLDQLSRNEGFQEKLKVSDWDLIVVDEAHKLSATYFGNTVKETKRFKLGKLLGSICRHFLLMTATPHNGKEADFQLFLSLLDGDRFYGKFRDGIHKVDISDMMRRMVKEDILKFDGTPLFPERRAYTANYDLSPLEALLYADVTEYVRTEMNRADRLKDGKRKGNVGFALTILQRRLASSPEAIYQSLKRRRKRLERRLEEMKLSARGEAVAETLRGYHSKNTGKASTHGNSVEDNFTEYTVRKSFELPENLDDIEDELSSEEYETYAEQVLDLASASETISELEAEICILIDLEQQALTVVQSESDRKWEELSKILQDQPEMYATSGNRRKLIIFTEHRDTLNYLMERIRGLLGKPEAVASIHGGTHRDERRRIQEEFRNLPELEVLVATDAAGEGVNLQNANLMINYDLPWNPNRLEQRFGRIHRIGQMEVCHLWNLVANETREGQVFQKLFDKLEMEKAALGGRVFDILGKAFENVSLKELLIEAIRYGEKESVREQLNQKIEGVLDTEHLQEIMGRNALVEQQMDQKTLFSVKEEMEKAEARKLQPYFIRAFFTEAFQTLGGEMRRRESNRYEIRHVPASIRERDRVIGETRTPVLKKYERICFEKNQTRLYGKALATLIHPGHPLMQSITDLILSAHRKKLKQGAVLLDPNDESCEVKLLFMMDHSIRESSGECSVSRRLQFVEITADGHTNSAGHAPHLDLKPIDESDLKRVSDVLQSSWVNQNLEPLVLSHASQFMVPLHYKEIKERRERQSDKILRAVNERLVKEIDYWQDRFIKLDEDVSAGKQPRMQPEMARRRVDELTARLEQRKKELEVMKNVVSSTPLVIGGAVVIPQGLLSQRKGEKPTIVDAQARARVEGIAMDAVLKKELSLGHQVKDVSAEKCGWDITSIPPVKDGKFQEERHIEVKGRSKGQSTITVSRNEIIYALNQADKFILAIVIVDENQYEGPCYIKNPFTQEPEFGVAGINYDLKDLLSKSVEKLT